MLEAYGIERVAEPAVAPGGLAGVVLERLSAEPASIDELARSLHLAPGVVAAALTDLELSGRVSEEDGLYRASITR